MVSLFPIAAITNWATWIYYLTVSKVRNPIQTGLAGLKSRSLQGCLPFWRLQGRICFLAIPSFRSPHSSTHGPFFHLHGQQWRMVSCHLTLTSSSASLLCFQWPWLLYGAQLRSTGQSQPLQTLHLIMSAKSPLPCKGASSQVLGTRAWPSLGRAIILPPTDG